MAAQEAAPFTPEEIIDAISNIALARYLSGVAATLVLYDWLLVLPTELDTIAKSKWTFPKILYYYIRIMSAPGLCFMAFQLSDLRGPLTKDFCRVWVVLASVPMFTTIVAGNWIFTLRLVALFRRQRYFVAFMIVFFGISISASFTMLAMALNTYQQTIDYFDLFGLCGALYAAPTFPAMFYAPAAYEAFLFVTTAYKAYQDAVVFSTGITAPFLIVLYRDGMVCFVIMFAIRAWNIWIYCTQPITSLNIGANVMWASNVILSTRVYLNLVWLVKKPDLTVLETGASVTGAAIRFRRATATGAFSADGNTEYGSSQAKTLAGFDLEEHGMTPITPATTKNTQTNSKSWTKSQD